MLAGTPSNHKTIARMMDSGEVGNQQPAVMTGGLSPPQWLTEMTKRCPCFFAIAVPQRRLSADQSIGVNMIGSSTEVSPSRAPRKRSSAKLRPRHEPPVRSLRAGGNEAPAAGCAQPLNHRVRPFPETMHLDRQIEPAGMGAADERRPFVWPRGLFRKSRRPRKHQQFVEISPEAAHQIRAAGQPDQRDSRRRRRGAQSPQRRDGAQQVAELQRTEHRDAAGNGVECGGRRHGPS